MPAKRSILGGRAPEALFRRLIGGPPRAHEAHERDLTVMFTDIVGFTQLAETLAPAKVAELLEEHFATLATRIEHERGVVDKLMGDGLLAFWGSKGAQAEPTAPALRAALAIRAAIAADNAARVRRGLAPIQLRVGLHAGPLVMAPLGTSGRLGVTPLGDTVNVAQRLEDAARHVAGGQDVTIVASDAVVARAGKGFRFESLGEIAVRGRCRAIHAFRLAG